MPALAPRIENTVLDDPAGERDARALWAALILHVAGRHWMRLYVPSSVPGKRGKYPDEQRLTWRNLPNRPAAVMIYNGNGRTRTLVFDFDPKPVDASPEAAAHARAAVKRDAALLISWVRQLGGVAVADTSSRGGIHVYVPLADNESLRCESLKPLYAQLTKLLPTLDKGPMDHPVQGCITPPGGRCPEGGFRTLVDMTIDDAIAAFTTRSAPGLAAKLRGLANAQLDLELDNPAHIGPRASTEDPDSARPTDYVPGPGPDDRLPKDQTSTRAVRPWVPEFLSNGTVPPLRDRLGKLWTPSHARLSVLTQYATRGASLNDIRTTEGDPDWAGFWAGYIDRKDRAHRLQKDWTRAYAQAEKRLAAIAEKSSHPDHRTEQVHTGGHSQIRDIRWKLAAARKWILLCGHFHGRQQWTALVVVTALATAIAMEGATSAAVGIRFLSIASGLCGQEAVQSVLEKLRSIDGSPVKWLARWDVRDHSGDRYTLVQPHLDGEIVRAAEWEAFAARTEEIDPVWAELGYSAWWVYTILTAIEPSQGETVAPEELAAAARVSLSTVHRATKRLQDAGLVDFGHGWLARTGRSPRQLPELTERADERRAERIARVQAERADFWGFWDIVAENWSAREITGYTSAADVERDTPAYLAAAIPDAQPPDTPDEPQGPDDEDEAALALLQLELGATILEEALCP